MAVSGTYAFNPQLVDQIDEAFERIGIDPGELKARHIRSAVRSANLVFSDWQNFGYKQFTLAFTSQALVQGTNTFTLPTGGIDIFHATLKRDGKETEVYPISRSDYNGLYDKTIQGRPDRYFVDRGSFSGADPASTVYLWQTPENSTDTLETWYIQKQQDAGDPSSTLDMSPNYYEAFACGLAWHLARKFAPDREGKRKADYLGEGYDSTRHSMPGGAMGRALSEDRDRSDAVLRVSFGRHRGSR